MSFINLPPSLQQIFSELESRLGKLENAVRFTLPNVATDPTYPVTGDLWLNTTSNTPEFVDANAVVRNLGTRTLISSIALSGTTSFTFSSIPATFTDLELRIRVTSANTSAGLISFTANGLSTGIYNWTKSEYSNTAGTGTGTITGGSQQTSLALNSLPTAGELVLTIRDYKDSNHYKIGSWEHHYSYIGSVTSGGNLGIGTLNALTSLAFTVATSGLTGTANLYGVN